MEEFESNYQFLKTENANLQAELEKAQFENAQLKKKLEQIQCSDRPDIQTQILRLLARGKELPADQIGFAVRQRNESITFHLEELQDARLIKREKGFDGYDEVEVHKLTQDGRRYLFQRGLLK